MKLCWLGIHKNTQWRTPRNGTQSRSCIHCGRYERRVVITHSDFEGWEVKELTSPENAEVLIYNGILEERTRPPDQLLPMELD